MRRVDTTNIKIPKKNKRILDSCRQKPFGSDVGFPSSTTVKCSECGRGSKRTASSAIWWEGLEAHCIQCSSVGGARGQLVLDLIIQSAAKFRNIIFWHWILLAVLFLLNQPIRLKQTSKRLDRSLNIPPNGFDVSLALLFPPRTTVEPID